MARLKNLLVLVALVAALILIFQNSDVVTTRFLVFSFEMPRVLLLAVMVLIGVILGLALGVRRGKK